MSSLRKRLLSSSTSPSGPSVAAKKKKKSGPPSLPAGWADFRNGDDPKNQPGPVNVTIENEKAPSPPKRRKDGRIKFPDYPQFQPNLTPREIMEAGAFGGCYFRPIQSAVVVNKTLSKNKKLKNQHKEFDFFNDLPDHLLCAPEYDASVNKYGVTCGGSLQMWQSKGWIADCDPYGWFQWYCRFYSGRRCSDDDRQVKRWLACTGAKGRWKRNLLTKVVAQSKTSKSPHNDPTISPVVRQTLLHWAYEITEKDVESKLAELG